MCGLFGAVCKGGRKLTLSTIRESALAQEKRGPHAFGFAWIDGANRIHHYKQEGNIAQNLDAIDMIGDAWAVVGHTRWFTHGSPEFLENNHPHPCDGGWICHNGQIPNYLELSYEHDLILNSECDSEVLAALIAQTGGQKSLPRRVVTSVNRCDRNRPLAMAGLWNRPGRLVLVRRGNPLMLGCGASGNVYFGTMKPKAVGRIQWEPMDNDQVRTFDLASGEESTEVVRRCTASPKSQSRVLGSNWFGESDTAGSTPSPKRGSNGHTDGRGYNYLGSKGPGMVQRATRLIQGVK